MKNKKKAPITLTPQQGKYISIAGGTYRVLISGKETAGSFAAIEMLIPPGGGPGPHAHAHFEESFFVIEGQVEVQSEFGVFVANKGSFIHIPKGGVVHGFKNNTGQVARLLCTVVPAGLEAFFEQIGQPVAAGEFLPAPKLDEAAIAKLQAIAKEYGQEIFPPDYFERLSSNE